jgi:trehalose 6-phosphate phosphatase
VSPFSPPPLSLLDGAALFLDFDGTLVELAETPDSIEVSPALPPLLRRLSAALDGRLAIVTGRAIDDLERYMDCAGVALSGSHGLELRLAHGEHIPLAAPIDMEEAREEIARFVDGRHGLIVENKPSSIALHYRLAPAEAEDAKAFMTALAERAGLTTQDGKMVVELRPKGADKGDAVRAFMTDAAFAGACPIFVGDDLTDEDAFIAVTALGGAGILVGPARASAASYRLDDVDAVADWLRRASA